MHTALQRFAILILVLHVAPPVSAQVPVSEALPAAGTVQPAVLAREAPRAEPGVAFHSIFTDLGRDLMRLPSKGTALTLGIGGALALAIHPADRTLTDRASLSVPLNRAFEVGEPAGSGWMQAGGAFAAFAIAKATGSRRAQSSAPTSCEPRSSTR